MNLYLSILLWKVISVIIVPLSSYFWIPLDEEKNIMAPHTGIGEPYFENNINFFLSPTDSKWSGGRNVGKF
jgi:hypothetical protein